MSALWDSDVRKAVKTTQLSQHELNQLKAQHLVPGTELNLGRQESRIPVLLLQNPGIRGGGKLSQNIMGYGSGWDVLLPSGWGMAFWVAMIYRGARAGGALESRSCALQQGVPHFPDDYIDTAAGRDAADALCKELEVKQAKWPPAKRPNYAKLGMSSPFNCQWDKLSDEWSEHCGDDQNRATSEELANESNTCPVLVVRDKAKLHQLNKLVHDKKQTQRGIIGDAEKVPAETKRVSSKRLASVAEMQDVSPVKKVKIDHNAPKGDDNENVIKAEKTMPSDTCGNVEMEKARTMQVANTLANIGLTNHPQMYVCVQVSLISKGAPAARSVIYLPTSDDLSALASNPRYGGPAEPIHAEYRLPKKPKKKEKTDAAIKADEGKVTTDKLGITNPDHVNLLTFCSRKVIGYVTNGAHAFSTGKGYGIGYCCMMGLQELLKIKMEDQSAVVLVRDTGSLQYRMAHINAIV